ncbi:chitin synthase 5 [Coccidioides immitis H538.4]|uniref:Chitin synthase 5 n=1 Tax=Coccidioides immitis H538.4 TaxID=396776 RepID=A0A0J8RM41_COCIT|nr:chitin synthase 5 [Coccidioides immitis H538.4]
MRKDSSTLRRHCGNWNSPEARSQKFAKSWLATRTGADESGGYSHEGGETITVVKNKDVLSIVAAFLGLSVDELETSLGYKTKTIHKERVTVMLDPQGARTNADGFARTLYALLVAYVIENINQRICAAEDAVANTISVVDFPGFAQMSTTNSTLDQLLNNAATESLYHYCLQNFFERQADMLETEEVNVPATSYFDNSDAVKGLLKHGNGLLSILDDQTKRARTDLQFLESIRKRFENKNPAIAGKVDYPAQRLIEENGDLVSGDLLNLISSTKSGFVRELFGQEALQTIHHPKERNAIMQAQVSSKPLRMPSMARRKMSRPSRFTSFGSQSEADDTDDFASTSTSTKKGGSSSKKGSVAGAPKQGAAGQFLASLDNITKSLSASNVNPYFVFCLKPNDRRIANQFDSKCVRTQVQTLGIAEISQRLRNADFSVFLPFAEFLGLAEAESIIVGSDKEKSQLIVDEKRWPTNEARVEQHWCLPE